MVDRVVEKYRNHILDPDKGYVFLKGIYSREQIDHYRAECEAFLASGRKIYKRINRDGIRDYVHPRTPLTEDRPEAFDANGEYVASTFRIYQYFHNRHSAETEELFDRVMSVRNAIEEAWVDDPEYRAERDALQEHIVVTKYAEDSQGLPRHRDYEGSLPHPFLQCLILLSDPGVDYDGGEFVLFLKNGEGVRIQTDLGMRKGDALIFDKTLEHSVDPTRRVGDGGKGRWSALIGARAPKEGRFYQELRYGAFLMDTLGPYVRRAKRLATQYRKTNSANSRLHD